MGTKKLPELLEGIQIEPREREKYMPALANGMVLATFLKGERDTLSPHDVLVMMKLESDRQPPREHIMVRLMGRFRIERNYVETMQLMEMFMV